MIGEFISAPIHLIMLSSMDAESDESVSGIREWSLTANDWMISLRLFIDMQEASKSFPSESGFENHFFMA